MRTLLPLLLYLLAPGLALAQADFIGAYVLSQRSATQGATSIEDERGNLYMAVPFVDTLKLKNPDLTIAAPSHRGQIRYNYAMALVKYNLAGARVGTQVLASGYNQVIRAKWLEAGSGKLRLAIHTIGEVTVGNQAPAASANRRWAPGPGYLDVDTNLHVLTRWQVSCPSADSTYLTIPQSMSNAQSGGRTYLMAAGYSDTVYLAGQAMHASRFKRHSGDPYHYVYVTAVDKANPMGGLPVTHILSQDETSSELQPAGMAKDSVGNIYVAFQYQGSYPLYIGDSLFTPRPIPNQPLCAALGLMKLSPDGRLLWKKAFANRYRVGYLTMTPTPSGDKLYLAVRAHGDITIEGTVVEADTNFVGCGSMPGNAVAMVLDENGHVEHYNMFVNRPKNRIYDTQINAISLSPYGEIYWAGTSTGYPKMFEQNPIQVWRTYFITCTDLDFNFRWRKMVGGPVDGTYRNLDDMSYNPHRRELTFIGRLENYVQPTAVGVGSTIVNTVCPAQFVGRIGGIPFTETRSRIGGPLAVFPNPSQSGQMVSVLSEDRSYRLTDALGRQTACPADVEMHTVTLPQLAPGLYTLTGEQSGKRVRLVIER